MSADVESIAYRGEDPWWIDQGIVDPEYVTKVERFYGMNDAVIAAKLDFRVDLKPMFVEKSGYTPGPYHTEVPDHFAVVRDRDDAVLGVVGNKFRPLQIEEVADFFRHFLDEGGLEIETLGALHGGKRIWVQAKFGSDEEVIPGDPVEKYLLLSHAHDGSLKVNIGTTVTRVVCSNTEAMARSNGDFFQFKHTENLSVGMDELKYTLDAAHQVFLLTMEKYRILADMHMGDMDQFQNLVRVVLAPTNQAGMSAEEILSEKPSKQMEKVQDQVLENYMREPTQTWWAGYNAISQYLTHQAPERGGSRQESLWFRGFRYQQNFRALQACLNIGEEQNK